MVFVIVRTQLFVDYFNAFSEIEKERVRRFIQQLQAQGDLVGKPLRHSFLREKKFNGKRMYFLIYEEWSAILLVTFSEKKNQGLVIQQILANLSEYRKFSKIELTKEGLFEGRLPSGNSTVNGIFQSLFDARPVRIACYFFVCGQFF